MLELLTEHKMEVTAATFAKHLIETISPVYTHHTYHRQIYAKTHTGTALEIERSEALDIGPCITALHKCQSVDSG